MLQITNVYTEYQINPLGIDEQKPRISWKLASTENNCRQSAFRIKVGTMLGACDMWDTGKVESDVSDGITYSGKELFPCSRYYLSITVWNQNGEEACSSDAWFETGLLDTSINAWEGAKWIGAPEKYISADTMGVFVLISKFQINKGGKSAGIVFGANDPRLLDSRKNQYEIAGENYIRYDINVETIPAKLEIYRVGYHPADTAETPFATILLDGEKQVITSDNRYEPHEIKIAVTGNCARTYIDDILIDEVEEDGPFGKSMEPRQLNPLGSNDITTFPRLNEIGYYAGANTKVNFDGISVRNFRAPSREVTKLDGLTLSGDDKGKQVTFNPSAHSLPMFRCNMNLSENKKIKSARLYITARGIYDCRINKEAITDTYFNPGASQFDKHIMYQTYDVTKLLHGGMNGIGVTLASGWWCDAQTFVVRNYNYYGDKESFLAKIVVEYEDGSRDLYVTNQKTWEYFGEGPYLYSGFFQGEHQDGRNLKLYDEFSGEDYMLENPKEPVEVVPDIIDEYVTMPLQFARAWPKVDHSYTKIVGGVQAPVVEVCRRKAVSMSEPRKGLYLYDLGQEMAGVPYIRLKGKKGTLVTIRYGEMLYPNLPEYGNLHGMMLTENYRDAESIDKYIMNGNPDGEIFTTKFSFHGYRYIEISGVDNPPSLEDVESIQLSSIPKLTGKLETSNPLVNRLIENVGWSQLCNFISIPTDCPQRNERMGWAGDAHVFCRTATYQSDARLFYYRYLEAFSDLQEESGQLPNIAPIGGGFGGITYESALILMVWELYQQYGDKEVIRRYYEPMSRWCEYIRGKGMPGMADVGPLGDWLATDETDNSLLWNIFYGRDMELMWKMSKAIGKDNEAGKYEALWKEAKAFWNNNFVDKNTGITKGADGKPNDTQCAYALALAYNMFDEDTKKLAYEHLARKTVEKGNLIGTGFFGTGVINPMLSEGGHKDLAYKLLLQTDYPSWLYPVTQGATTVWERWNSYTVENGFGGNNSMNSFNHYSLGSVLSWIYETVLGIKRDEEQPGYHHFRLEPAMMVLDNAKGGFDTNYGRIESSWTKQTDGRYLYKCTIPCNTSATVCLMVDGKRQEMELGSGAYEFAM